VRNYYAIYDEVKSQGIGGGGGGPPGGGLWEREGALAFLGMLWDSGRANRRPLGLFTGQQQHKDQQGFSMARGAAGTVIFSG
jgi:hypothetical protein